MEIVRRLTAPGPALGLFEHVASLDRYAAWMPLIHAVEAVPGASRPTWDVELRANVGPFARSKRLRMERTEHDPPYTVRFERQETDGRSHAPWVLDARIADAEGSDSTGLLSLTMRLHYGGGLWTGAAMERVLDRYVEQGSVNLLALVSAEPRP